MLRIIMSKLNNHSGFSAVEALLILIIVGILGFTGWYVYHAKQTSNKDYSAAANSTVPSYKKKTATKPTATVAPDPYTGWKSASLKYEKVAYKYPSDWTVTDKSASSPKGAGCVYPGTDNVILTSPSNHQVELRTGLECNGGAGAKIFDTIPVASLGQNLHISLAASDLSGTPTDPTSACLYPTATQAGYPPNLKSKNLFVNGSSDIPDDEFCYFPYLFNSRDGTPPQLSASEMENSADFTTAKLIFESMKY